MVYIIGLGFLSNNNNIVYRALFERSFNRNEHKETLLNLEMQGAAHRAVIEDAQEFNWMHQLT